MAKIKKINRVKRASNISPLQKNLQNVYKKLSKEAKAYEDYQKEASKKYKNLSLDKYLKILRNLVKAFNNKLTIKNSLDYIDKKRVDRAKKQLRVFYINSIKSKSIFRFVVKSSGLNPPKAYFVEIKFKDLEVMALQGISHKEILLNSRIATQCSCDDFKYRFRYWLTKMGAVLGVKEHRYPKITNPNGEHLFLCKHQALLFSGIQNPAFMDGIFKRYVKNYLEEKDTRVTKKDKEKTLRSSYKHKIKEVK